jgi:streptogramin lyase
MSSRFILRLAVALFLTLLASALSGPSVGVSGFMGAPGVDGPPDEARAGSVWVVNRDKGELAVFDAGSGEVLAQMAVGAGAHDICISEHAGKAHIMAETINSVTTVDTRTLEIEAIPVSPMPHHCEPSDDGASSTSRSRPTRRRRHRELHRSR